METMQYIYIVCAAVGGTIMVCQFLMSLMGIGGDHDASGHHDAGHDVGHDAHHGDGHHHGHESTSDWLVSMLTFRTIVAALTFFGLGGLLAYTREDLQGPMSVGIGLAFGLAAMLLVAYLMRALSRLHAEGTARIERSVGKTGTVYLPVPAQKAGIGKVHLNLQNRTVEYQAVTSQNQLPTGAKIVVVGVVSTDTVEVAPANESGRTSNV